MTLEQVIKERNPSSVWLLDLSWHLYRNYYIFKNLTAGQGGRPTGHLYGFLQTIEQIRAIDLNSLIIICQDGFPKRRYELLSQDRNEVYKEGRSEQGIDVKIESELIKGFTMPIPNIFWAYHSEYESDDLLYSFAKKSEELGIKEVIIYTGDNDLLQAITENIRVCRSHSKSQPIFYDLYELANNESLTKKYYGLSGIQLVLFRSIIGDTSDKITGIPRFPRELASQIAGSSNNLDDLFRDDILNPIKFTVSKAKQKWFSELQANEKRVRTNYEIMKLNVHEEFELEKLKPNIQAVLKNLESLRLTSFRLYLEGLLGL